MGKQEFEKFLQSELTPGRPAFDAEATLSFWREKLALLYGSIEEWLADYKDKIALSFEDVSMHESLLGNYAVSKAIIRIGTKQAQLKPIGTDLIGTPGRVDLEGPAGSIKLILADRATSSPNSITSFEEFDLESKREKKPGKRENKPVDWVWKAATPAPRIRYATLTQDIFFDCLLSVLDA